MTIAAEPKRVSWGEIEFVIVEGEPLAAYFRGDRLRVDALKLKAPDGYHRFSWGGPGRGAIIIDARLRDDGLIGICDMAASGFLRAQDVVGTPSFRRAHRTYDYDGSGVIGERKPVE